MKGPDEASTGLMHEAEQERTMPLGWDQGRVLVAATRGARMEPESPASRCSPGP
jgi:hypothetical protein